MTAYNLFRKDAWAKISQNEANKDLSDQERSALIAQIWKTISAEYKAEFVKKAK